ncbi:hypothetical protein E4U51_008344 [Claviceps purpurea]|uniref:Uncharacterized protein n=1 Tax=Claviceps arundinis TaxID=1623583 RepID=A0A9P7MM75_9HYPO|nr:hypothetical protein E4U56_006106 [Claviceps arundinis]KAG6155824.1 hypothetical protein E4U51_008344 [Claviceps purpurea]
MESASLYTSDEHYFDDASDIQEDISSEGEESFLARTRRRIIRAPDFSASQAGMFQETCCMDYVIEALTLSPSDPARQARAAARGDIWSTDTRAAASIHNFCAGE